MPPLLSSPFHPLSRAADQKRKRTDKMADIDKPKGQDSGGDVSLSVDETNKLRAQLGLKPLEMEVKEEKAGSNKNPLDYLAMKEEEEERKKTDELQRKIEEMKKQRKVASKVMAVKGLGEASDGEDDIDNAAKWVKRSRKKHQALADKLAKQLQEQEEQDAEQAKQVLPTACPDSQVCSA